MIKQRILAAAMLGLMQEAEAVAASGGAAPAEAPAAKPKKEKSPVEKVKMSDGREVDFVGKRKMLKESFVKDGVVSVRFDFRNKETRTFTIPTTLVNKFAAHGAEQKIGDETAGLEDVDDAVIAVDALIERLNVGEWGVKRESNGMAGTSVLARALVELKGVTIEKVKAFLSNKTAAQKTALRDSAELKPIVQRIEAEKAKKGSTVDTGSLLGELDDAPVAAGVDTTAE